MKRPSMQIGLGIALGAGIGTAIAVALGSGGAWLGIGVAIGIAIGAAMWKRKTGSSRTRLGRVSRNDKGLGKSPPYEHRVGWGTLGFLF